VFELERPTAEVPYIKGLLDPCTNSKLAPNIPAEKLYDKQDNGLKLSNSWEGFSVLLNPDYRAQARCGCWGSACRCCRNHTLKSRALISTWGKFDTA
jgi:hypothetical protein